MLADILGGDFLTKAQAANLLRVRRKAPSAFKSTDWAYLEKR